MKPIGKPKILSRPLGTKNGVGPSVWTPARALDDALPIAWIDPSITISLFQDMAMTTSASADGLVGAAVDQSGNGNHFIATGDDATRLTRKDNALNGLTGLYSDATTKGLKCASLLDSSFNKAFTFLGVSNGALGVTNIVGFGSANPYIKDRNYGSNVMYFNAYTIQTLRMDHSSGWGKRLFAYTYNGSRMLMKGNNHARVFPHVDNLGWSGDFSIGHVSLAGSAASTMEAIVYKHGFSDADMETLLTYAANKYALTKNAVSQRIVFIGDSLTFGFGLSPGLSYPDRFMADLNDPSLYCYNISRNDGLTAYAFVNAYPLVYNEFIDDTALVFVWLGSNDIKGGRTGAQAYGDVVTICNAIKSAHPGATIVVTTVIDRTDFDAGMDTQVASLNSSITTNYATFADVLFDLAGDSRFQDGSDTTYFNVDGIHINNTGAALAATLAEAVYAGL